MGSAWWAWRRFSGICSILGINLDRGYTVVILTNGDNDCMVADEFIKDTLYK